MVLRRKFASDASFELIVVSVRSVSLLCPVSARSLSVSPGIGCPRAATPHNPGEVTLPAPRAHVQGCDCRREPTGPHSPSPPRVLGRPDRPGSPGVVLAVHAVRVRAGLHNAGEASATLRPCGLPSRCDPRPMRNCRRTARSSADLTPPPRPPRSPGRALRRPHHAVRPEPFLPLQRRCSLSPVFTAALTEASRAPLTPR